MKLFVLLFLVSCSYGEYRCINNKIHECNKSFCTEVQKSLYNSVSCVINPDTREYVEATPTPTVWPKKRSYKRPIPTPTPVMGVPDVSLLDTVSSWRSL
jgi:hypothetical protein